MKKEEKNQE